MGLLENQLLFRQEGANLGYAFPNSLLRSQTALGDELNSFFSGIDIGDYMEIASGIMGDATLSGLEDMLAQLTMLSESGMEFNWQGNVTQQAQALYNQITDIERQINQVYGANGV